MNAGPVTAEEIDAVVEGEWFDRETTDRVSGHELDVLRSDERRRLATRARSRGQTLHPEVLASLLESGAL